MTLLAPWGHDGQTYTGQDMRQLIESFATAGVVGANDYLVTEQDVPDDTVKVAQGLAVVDATGAGLFGRYLVPNIGDETSPSFTPTDADGRIDEVILRITDGVAAIEIVEGTPSGTPTPPAITGDNYLHLARVTLPPGTSIIDDSMIDDKRTFARARLALPPDVQVFVSSGTWTKPAGPRGVVYAICIGGGGGGGSGRKGDALTTRGGGGGGGGGGCSEGTFDIGDIESSVAVTVGAGGAGGASVTTNNTSGNPGTAGGTSTFGSHVIAGGGGGGGGGTSAASGAGGTGGLGMFPGGGGGAGSHTATGAAGGLSNGGGGGGGGGGGIDSASATRLGGDGGATLRPLRTGGAGGNPQGDAGDPGTGNDPSNHRPLCGAGGGGGAAIGGNFTAGAGGDGGRFGGGGGGGAACSSGGTSGKGGDGAPGVVVVITY